MKISIINANTDPGSCLEHYINDLENMLKSNGNKITRIDLQSLDFAYCIGCFGCWVKTPGACSSGDGSVHICQAIVESDFTLWAAPLRMGFPNALLKRALDKSIPLVLPYFDVVNGEAHHRSRYPRYPRLGLLVEPEADTDARDLILVTDIFSRTALNLKSRLEFCRTTDESVKDLVQGIQFPQGNQVLFEKGLTQVPGQTILPPLGLSIFNGSPRGRKGNTPILLSQFAQGFTSLPGRNTDIYHLNRFKEMDRWVEIFAKAECVWIGFPLYTDAMPGMVKAFIDALGDLRGRSGNPPVGFLVQSGFPEAAHSRHVERYLEKLAARLGSPYLGTIVKGGGEGVRMMPDNANRKLFEGLQALGRGFSETGALDPLLLRQVVGTERYPAYLIPLFKLLVRTPVLNFYWDTQLKENLAYEQRFARPYWG